MKTTANTILITGGSAGIGFEMAKQFLTLGNKVIITGRDAGRLSTAAAELGDVIAIPFDVTRDADVTALVQSIKNDFPELNVLVNNAGQAYVHNLGNSDSTYSKASDEMLTNYLSVVRLTEELLPLLEQQPDAAVINVSSIVAFVPSRNLPTYSASKAALHSYTKSLRLALKETGVKVFELMPPLVNTQFSSAIGGENGILPEVLVNDLIDALAHDRYEIRTGLTQDIYQLSLVSPDDAFAAMNA